MQVFRPRALTPFVVSLLISAYLLVYSGRLHSIDEYAIFAVTESLAKTGQPTMNQLAWAQWGERPGSEQGRFGLSGDLYAKKGPATSLLALLFYWLGGLAQGIGRIEFVLLLPPLLTALTALVLCACANVLGYGTGPAVALALIFGLATPALVYSKSLFGEPVATLGLSLALWGILGERRPWRLLLAGAGLGLATAANWLIAVCVIPFALYIALVPPATLPIRSRATALIAFTTPFALTLAALAAYNLARFGLPWQTGYHFETGEGFTADLGIGLYGLLVSPARGILWYAPVVFIGVLGWPAFHRRHPAAAWLCLGIVAPLLFLTAKWWQWWGGYGWGPRLLLPLLPLVLLPALPILAHARGLGRGLLIGLAALSLGIQLLGALIDYGDYEMELARRFPDDRTHPLVYVHSERALHDWRLSPILAHVRRLSTGPYDVAWWPQAGLDIGALLPGLILIGLISLSLVSRLRSITPLRILHEVNPLVLAVVLPLIYTAYILPRYHQHPLTTWYEDYTALLNDLSLSSSPDDAILTIVPEVAQAIMDRYPNSPPVYGLGYLPQPQPELERLLSIAASRHNRLWLVTWLPPGSPDNWPEHLLLQTTVSQVLADNPLSAFYPFSNRTPGGLRLTGYLVGHPALPAQTIGGRLGEYIRLKGASAALWPHPDRIDIAVALQWEAEHVPGRDYQVFAHLIGPDGTLIAQYDHTPIGGLRPTSSWAPGEIINDRFGFSLPAGATGPFRLRLGLYELETGARLPAYDSFGHRLPDDAFEVRIGTQEQ